jgi:hypothetical protein
MQPDLLKPMSDSEVKGLRLVPSAVAPGVFQEHMEGMQRGGASTQPQSIYVPQGKDNSSFLQAPTPGGK